MHERNLVCVWHLNIFKAFDKTYRRNDTSPPSPPSPQILHYVVTIQACLYNDVEQWLQQLLDRERISKSSVHKFKTMQEQVTDKYSQLLTLSGLWSRLSNNGQSFYLFTDQFDEANISKRPGRYQLSPGFHILKVKLAMMFAAWSLMELLII